MAVTRVLRSDAFPDLTDEVLYPRLSDAKLDWLSERGGVRKSFEPGEVLYEHAVRDAPFFVIERGLVEFIDRKPGKDVHVAQADAGTFIGDIAIFTGEPTISACVAVEPTDVIAFDRAGLRDLLERNLLPVRWYDVDTDEESAKLLEWLHIPREETPVLVHARNVMRNPSAAQVARALGLRAEVDGQRFDLVVVGAGPAGLAAAVYGGSEGLRTFVAESWAPGGQAGTSARIENYLGFPSGIGGRELTTKATLQARRFDAVLSSFHPAVELADGPDGLVRVDLDDGQHVVARTLLVATGAQWRTLEVDGIDRFKGAGVYHVAMATDARRCEGEDVIVVGGGNSAGQAAVHLSRRGGGVRMGLRGDNVSTTMSRYLLNRIERTANIEVVPNTEVAAVHGDRALEAVSLRESGNGRVQRIATSAVFVMIGAHPCTDFVGSMLAVDDAGFVLCGSAARERGWSDSSREPYLLETVRPGVFVAGDVRSESTKRVAGAVGDGALAVRFAHQVLDG